MIELFAKIALLTVFAGLAVLWIQFFYFASEPKNIFYFLIAPLDQKLAQIDNEREEIEKRMEADHKENNFKNGAKALELKALYDRIEWICKPLFLCTVCMSSVHGFLIYSGLWISLEMPFPFGWIVPFWIVVGGVTYLMEKHES